MHRSPSVAGLKTLAEATQKIDALDARILLGHVLKAETAYLIAHAAEALDPEQAAAFDTLVARRVKGEPIAYITGRREFFGLDFRVTPAVLIPRPETELLVDLALARIPEKTACDVLDLGTGSGCVAISIGRHRPQARVTAVDRSTEALALARDNARALAARNVAFAAGEWFGAVAGQCFDLIVANPPYVAEGDPHLAQGDLRFEPALALCGGRDGLDAIRAIVAAAGRHFSATGWLLFEHGYDQAAACRALLQAAGFTAIDSWRDLAGHERVSGGRKLDGSLR
ncbi:MAG: peptide chain release factor N(5)-glutamine methyltransferase [Betaproteobacteria bacterium]|nr:peptide chain release factor N(5)-glutamine methyltransferase [Betaproteobacteria bacterium]